LKRYYKKTLYVLLALIVVVGGGTFVYTYVRFNYDTIDDSPFKIEPSALAYYRPSYAECRQAFRTQAKALSKARDDVEIFTIPVRSQKDSGLTIDGCYVPAPGTKTKLIILTSGVHGVEGFVGSAVQNMFMAEFLTTANYDDVGFLLLHGLNPWGMKHLRRVAESNVDLNRNCDVDPGLYNTQNKGYVALNDFINPQDRADAGSVRNRLFHLYAANKLAFNSMATLRQAVLQGQYRFEKGLYFGGKSLEPQLVAVRTILQKYAAPYKVILNIDIHTGYGARGVLHFLPNPIEDSKIKTGVEQIFAGYAIDWGESDDFYTVNGEFSPCIGKVLPESVYFPMIFEYGTMDSQTMLGAIKSLHIMVLENQGFHYGYATKKDESIIKQALMEMYYPSSKGWRSEVIVRTREVLKNILPRFAAMDAHSN